MHIPPGFDLIDGELAIAGRPASHWTAQAGDTPLFVYDRRLIARRLEALRAAMPTDLDIHYAIKANPMPALVRWMAGAVDGIDIASAGELQVALAAGADARRISFAGPGKRDGELEQAINADVLLNIESEGELERAAATARLMRLNSPTEYSLRILGGAPCAAPQSWARLTFGLLSTTTVRPE